MNSKIQSKKECFLCGNTVNLELHHCLGAANRKNSDKYGLTVWLCGDFTKYKCHKGKNGPHQNKETAELLHQVAQRVFEREHSREEWMRIFGRNYLGDSD